MPIPRYVLIPFVIGIAYGFTCSYANHSTHTILNSISVVIGGIWAWALLPIIVGAFFSKYRQAIIAGMLCLIGAVTAYYVSDLLQGTYQTVRSTATSPLEISTAWQSFASDGAFWLVVALVAGGPLGFIGSSFFQMLRKLIRRT